MPTIVLAGSLELDSIHPKDSKVKTLALTSFFMYCEQTMFNIVPKFIISTIVAVSVLGSTAHAQTPTCKIFGKAPFTTPDNSKSCTPGAFTRLSHQQVCASKNRPSLTASTRRTVLSNYGVPNWTGANGEIDHRIPVFLGGLTVARNLWPESGSIPNPKDALEFRVFRRVCFGDPVKMRVKTARRIFLSNWILAYAPIALGLSPLRGIFSN